MGFLFVVFHATHGRRCNNGLEFRCHGRGISLLLKRWKPPRFIRNAAAKEVGEAELLVDVGTAVPEPGVSDCYHGLALVHGQGKRDENADRGAYVPLPGVRRSVVRSTE